MLEQPNPTDHVDFVENEHADVQEGATSELEATTYDFLYGEWSPAPTARLECAVVWGDTRVQDLAPGPAGLTFGRGGQIECDRDIDMLIAMTDSTPRLLLDDTWAGSICIGEDHLELQDYLLSAPRLPSGRAFLPLSKETRFRIDAHGLSILGRYALPAAAPTRRRFSLGLGVFICVAISLIVHSAFLLLGMFMPPKAQAFELQDFAMESRAMQFVINPQEQMQPDEPKAASGESNAESDKVAARAPGEETQSGKETAKRTPRRRAIKGPKDSKIEIAKERAFVQTQGALAVLSKPVSAAWGTGQVTTGVDPVSAMGGATGDRFGDAYGFGGFGVKGIAAIPGGGGQRTGFTMGTGDFLDGQPGGKRVYNAKVAAIKKKEKEVPVFVPGRPIVGDGLPKDVVRRIVRKHSPEVRYCYEQELIRDKSLAGRVVMQFTISGAGSVVAAVPSNSTLNNRSVERCISGKMRRWVFPSPKGGGVVTVKYPFRFATQ